MIRVPLILLAALRLFAGQVDFKVTHDEPLNITWFAPQKPPVKMIRRGIIRTGWRCFPVAYQDFARGTKGLVLNIEANGISRYNSTVSFAVDGQRTDLSGVSWVTPVMMFGGTGMIAKASINDQERLIEQIAKASEVWIVTGPAGEESKVKLSPEQLTVFARVVEKYSGLDPK